MILVDDVLLSDLARKNKKIRQLAARNSLSQNPDADLGDLFSKGVSKQPLFREISGFSEEKEDEDLL